MNAARLLLSLWLLPITIPVWLLYILPLWALGWIEYTGSPGFLVARFYTVDSGNWYSKLWRSWGGQALPHAMVLRVPSVTTEAHELRHTDQWLVFGPLFPIVYVAILLVTGYVNHPFEKDARAWARRNSLKYWT